MEYDCLNNLPLSPGAIACYQSLCERGPATAGELAQRLGKHRTGIYRELKQLSRKGFVTSHKERAGITYFYSIILEHALENLADYYFSEALSIIQYQRSKAPQKNRRRDYGLSIREYRPRS